MGIESLWKPLCLLLSFTVKLKLFLKKQSLLKQKIHDHTIEKWIGCQETVHMQK